VSDSPRAGARDYEALRNLEWSRAEKAVARKAFDQALRGELEAVVVEAKERAGMIRQSSDLWELERYLTERRTQIDRQFDYRYSLLIFLFGNLIQQGKLSEKELQGLSDDKLDAIRRYASFEFSTGSK
jgi:hypothetical protein